MSRAALPWNWHSGPSPWLTSGLATLLINQAPTAACLLFNDYHVSSCAYPYCNPCFSLLLVSAPAVLQPLLPSDFGLPASVPVFDSVWPSSSGIWLCPSVTDPQLVSWTQLWLVGWILASPTRPECLQPGQLHLVEFSNKTIHTITLMASL